ncbi:MAG: phospholipase [Gemmatimonadota bacterium]
MSDPKPTGAAEHHIEVPRTARYLTLGPSSTSDVWIVLHGYGQLARRFLRRFTPIDDGTRSIVAPEGASRFYVGNDPGRHGPRSVVGATWMTREDRETEIRDYVRYLDLLGARVVDGAPRVTVLGFSQGVATAARWATLGRVRPARLVLWGDFLPPDLDLDLARERWRNTDVVLVRGDDDGALRSEELAAEENARMDSAGLRVRTVRYPGGHDIHEETLVRLAVDVPVG